MIDLSDVYLVSRYLCSILTRLIRYSLSLSMCLSLCSLVRNTSNLTHDGIDILCILRRYDLSTCVLQGLATKLPYTSGYPLGMMKMRYLNLMPIVEIARKSTVSYSICIGNLLSLRCCTALYDIWVLLRYLLCYILLISTRFVSKLLDIKSNHMTVVLRCISIRQTSICCILPKQI